MIFYFGKFCKYYFSWPKYLYRSSMDSKWLHEQFTKHPGLTKGDLSKALGIQASGISKMLAGTRQIKAREYLLMRTFFDMPGSGGAVEKRKSGIHMYADLRAEEPGHQTWTGKPDAQKDKKFSIPAAYDIVEVGDSDMAPDFLPGERVLIDTSAKSADKAGVYAIEEQSRVFIRMLERSASGLRLSSIGKDAPAKLVAAGKVKILGRVIARLTWL